MEIYTMVDFIKNYAEQFKDFAYPEEEGIFRGKIIAAHWSTGAIIHTYWLMNDGRKLDCVLFRDTRPFDVAATPCNAVADIQFVKTSSSKIYAREVNFILYNNYSGDDAHCSDCHYCDNYLIAEGYCKHCMYSV